MQGYTVTPLVIVMIVLLGVAAFFSLSETALMSVGRVRLRQLEKKRPRQVRIVESILEKPEKLIATILFGNNLANIALSAIATFVATTFWGGAGIIYVTIGLTIIVFIFTENTPKIYARYHSDTVSLLTAPVLKVIMGIFQPIVAGVTWIAQKLLLLVGMDIKKTRSH
jgi:putative hemolysin